MEKILIVEDDREIAARLSELLTEEGFLTETAYTRREALELTERQSFDLALVDLTLPDGNGYPICAALRRRGGAPVIFLTAADDEASIVTGFDLGAEDYITKPFRPLELIARIRRVLRKSGRNPSLLRLGDIEIDTARGLVKRGGCEVALSALEYRLLLVFAAHPGEVLSRERLLEEIWDAAGDYVNDNTLTVYIKRLREKLEADPTDPHIICTVRGIGYRTEDLR